MRAGKNRLEDEDDKYEEFGGKKDATPLKNGNSDKANVTRSKHSVTEQRRRSKINERYQLLRGIIPHSDQKMDTASFLLEVIHYVQFLQEKVQKYEGSYQTWGTEPIKLVPWRNSQWNAPGFVVQPQISSLGSTTLHGRYDENIAASMQHFTQNHTEEMRCGSMEPESENANNVQAASIINEAPFSHMIHPSNGNSLKCQDELTIENGTTDISSVYSQGLLNSLTQALQATGLDLSQATISVQIKLGRRADKNSLPGDQDIPVPGDQSFGGFQNQEISSNKDMDRVCKRQKT